MTTPSRAKRAPSFFERYYLVRGVLEFYTNFNVVGRYNRRVLRDNLSNALGHMIAHTPSLVANFFRTSGDDLKADGHNFELRVLDRIAFDDVVSFQTLEQPFGETTLEWLDTLVLKFDVLQPLWKLIVLDLPDGRQYVAVYFEHTLFDGTSGFLFHRDLVAALDCVEPHPQFRQTLFAKTADSVVPPLNAQALQLYTPSTLFLLKTVVSKLLVPQWVLKQLSNIVAPYYGPLYVNTLKTPPFTYLPARRGTPTYFKLVNIDLATATRVLQQCKRLGFTVTPFLLVVVLASLQEVVFRRCGRGQCLSETIIAVNNRRYLDSAAAGEYGLIVSGSSVSLPPLPESATVRDMLPYVIEARDKLQRDLALNECSQQVGCLHYVSALKFLLQKLNQLGSRATVDYSNAGVKRLAAGEWEVEDLVFSQSNGLNGHFGLNVTGTARLGINMSLGYLEEYRQFPMQLVVEQIRHHIAAFEKLP